MKEVIAYIERGQDHFSVYIKDELPFGVHGTGQSVAEAKRNFLDTFNEMREVYKGISGKEFNCTFVFEFDIESLFEYYKGILTMPAIEKLCGINQKQLHHYATGHRKPREAQRKKIESVLHKLGKELQDIRL